MTIAKLITEKVNELGNKSEAARRLGVTRPTLDHWMYGVHNPEPDRETVSAISEFTGRTEGEVLGMLLKERGIDLSILANVAKGGSLRSFQPAFA